MAACSKANLTAKECQRVSRTASSHQIALPQIMTTMSTANAAKIQGKSLRSRGVIPGLRISSQIVGLVCPGTSGNDSRSESRVFQNCPKAHKTPSQGPSFPRGWGRSCWRSDERCFRPMVGMGQQAVLGHGDHPSRNTPTRHGSATWGSPRPRQSQRSRAAVSTRPAPRLSAGLPQPAPDLTSALLRGIVRD